MLIGKHLIAGEWVGSDETFKNTPISGEVNHFSVGTSVHVEAAVVGAEQAFLSYGYSSRIERAKFLRQIAEEIESRAEEITAIGVRETGYPEARLNGERGRAIGQFHLFADTIEAGDYLDRRFDEALPDRIPLPRPDIRLLQRPVGPVAVFGASNFPIAFSTAGGDTAAALAAGCPVVVRGHSAHPGVSDIVAQAIHAAIEKCGIHPGVFSQIQGGDYSVGHALVSHPLIQAVGFTGSLRGGRALFDICAGREVPIPFYGELGSINPMFLLPEAMQNRSASIATGWAASLTMGVGQFCTNPGLAIVLRGKDADELIEKTGQALSQTNAQPMLTEGIASAFYTGKERIKKSKGVKEILGAFCDSREVSPCLYVTTGKEWLENKALSEEVFGPLGMVVIVEDVEEMLTIANTLQGQLACVLHLDDADLEIAKKLMPVLERKAGRVLANGFPTGVEVCDAMVHGGPYPASTNFGATAVGSMSIRRFLRSVAYQNIPENILPLDIVS
jgi:alpha-ketoglutaric semialdehyde dehydrogenase